MNAIHFDDIETANVVADHLNLDSTDSIESNRVTFNRIAEYYFQHLDTVCGSLTTTDVFYNGDDRHALIVGYNTICGTTRLVVLIIDENMGFVVGEAGRGSGMCTEAYSYTGEYPAGLVF